jgi:hypothetical protein
MFAPALKFGAVISVLEDWPCRLPMAEEALDRRVTGRCRHAAVDGCILAEENDAAIR